MRKLMSLHSLHWSKLYIGYSQTVRWRREGGIANQCRTGRYATLSLSSNFSSPLIADTLYWFSSCCWWEDDSGLSRDRYLLMHWYTRTPASAPTTNAMVPVTTAIPVAMPMLIVCIIPDEGNNDIQCKPWVSHTSPSISWTNIGELNWGQGV